MKHRIEITPMDPEDMFTITDKAKDFDFQKIRPMADTLNINGALDKSYGKYGRDVYIAEVLKNNFPITSFVYGTDNLLSSLVVPGMRALSLGEQRMKYDREVAISRGHIRKLPIEGRNDRLHYYGQESKSTAYLFSGENITPKCQADAVYLGKITWMNMIQYGAFSKDEWIMKNWGSENPEKIHMKGKDGKLIYFFETPSTIFPLLTYIIALLEDVKFQIKYVFGEEGSEVTMIKPEDSNYFTEV